MSKFIIVGTQRTGSSALAESLNFHPEIACGWEWPTDISWQNKLTVPERALNADFSLLGSENRSQIENLWSEKSARWLGYRHLFRSSNKWILNPGFSPPLWVDRFSGFIKWINTRPDIYLIHIVRNDNMSWLKSKFLSRETNSYVGKKYPDHLQIDIPLRNAVARVQSKNWVDLRLNSLKLSNPYLKVNFEDMSADLEKEIHGVFKFLGCDLLEMKNYEGRIKPQSGENVRSQIKNWDLLQNILKDKNLLNSSLVDL